MPRKPITPKNKKKIIYENEFGEMDYKYVSYRSLATEKGMRGEYDKWAKTYSRQRNREIEMLGSSHINPQREAYLKVTGKHTAVEERRVALKGVSKEKYMSVYDRAENSAGINAIMKEITELRDRSDEKYAETGVTYNSADPLWIVYENIEKYDDMIKLYEMFKEGEIDSKEFWRKYHETFDPTPHEVVRRMVYGDS